MVNKASVKSAKEQRIAIEAQIAEAKVDAARVEAMLQAQLKALLLEEKFQESKQVHVQRINDLLETARQALEEAGLLGAEHGINFTFAGPREALDFNIGWMSSDCYGTYRWYDQGHQGGYDN